MTTIRAFVPICPRPLKNMRGHWRIRHNYSSDLRGWTAVLVGAQMGAGVDPASPKRITLVAHLPRLLDPHDGLRTALAPVVDGLQVRKVLRTRVLAGCGAIHHDGPRCGHEIQYDQTTEEPYGVEVTVEW